jgi:hypothetical protein
MCINTLHKGDSDDGDDDDDDDTNNNNNNNRVHCSFRNMVVCELSPLLSAAKNRSSFQLLPASLITDLLQLFLGLPLFLLP